MAEPGGSDNRTEDPTPKRRKEAREEGRIARSAELAAAVLLLAGTALLAGGSHRIGAAMLDGFHNTPALLLAEPPSLVGAAGMVRAFVVASVIAMLPIGFGLVLASLVVGLVQTRGLVTTKPLAPKLERISPMKGFRRIFGAEAAINLVKSSGKLILLGVITYTVLRGALPRFVELADAAPLTVLVVLKSNLTRLVLIVGLAFLGLGALDYAIQFLRTEKGLKMARQEVVQEHREQEGDPQIKARIRQIARQRARQRMLSGVASADVVVVNPTHVAIALKYDGSVASAPIVVAMGERKLAERIKAIAAKAGIPVVENRPLARALLATCRVGAPIPPAMYVAVAEILAWVYRRRRTRQAALVPVPAGGVG